MGQKLRQIEFRYLGAAGVPLVQMTELHPEKSSLKLVEAGVHPFHLIVVTLFGPIIPQHANPIRQCRIVGSDGSRIAQCPQVLGGIETVPGRMTQRAGPAPTIARSLSLGGVFQHL